MPQSPIPSNTCAPSAIYLARSVLDTRAAVVLAGCLGVGADVDERGPVAVGLGDTDDLTTLARSNTLDVNLARALLAGTARSVDLAVVLSIEVDDLFSKYASVVFSSGAKSCIIFWTYVDLAASVVLDDLVRGVVSTTTNDPRHIARPVVLLY